MVTRKLRASDRAALKKLGRRIELLILKDRGYRSLDAFAVEFHDLITKPTLYEICAGTRDMKFSTLNGLAEALGMRVAVLLDDT